MSCSWPSPTRDPVSSPKETVIAEQGLVLCSHFTVHHILYLMSRTSRIPYHEFLVPYSITRYVYMYTYTSYGSPYAVRILSSGVTDSCGLQLKTRTACMVDRFLTSRLPSSHRLSNTSLLEQLFPPSRVYSPPKLSRMLATAVSLPTRATNAGYFLL